MKQLLPLLFACILFSSCNKGDNSYPIIEDVTTGSKWGMHIGNNAADVYTQLQTLGQQKQFTEVELVGPSTFDQPADIGERVILYSGISFEEKDNVHPNRVIIRFWNGKVSDILAGGSLPDAATRWPVTAPDDKAILQNEPLDHFYEKLQAIAASGALEGYALRLGAKLLPQFYDPNMAAFERWHVAFTNGAGNSAVDLYFKVGRLHRIHHEYSESQLYN